MAKVNRKTGLLSIDWLQYNIKSPFFINREFSEQIETFDSRIILMKEPGHTKLFLSRYTMYFEGYEIADVLTQPRNPKINKPYLISIRIHNHLLYGKELWDIIPLISKCFSGKFNNITRLDLACDSFGFLPYMTQFNQRLLYNKSQLGFAARLDNQGKVTTMNLGSRLSDKYSKVYDKTLELIKSEKLYIRKAWENNGLSDKEQHIHRLEITLKSQVFLLHPEFTLSKLRNPLYVVQLFVTEVLSQIKFYKPRKDVKPENIPNIKLLPEDLRMIKRLDKTKKMTSKIVWRKKLHIKSQIEEFVYKDGNLKYLESALELVEEYQLGEWFERKWNFWIDYFTGLREKTG